MAIELPGHVAASDAEAAEMHEAGRGCGRPACCTPTLWQERPSSAWPTEHEPDCAIRGREGPLDNRTVLADCTCPVGNL